MRALLVNCLFFLLFACMPNEKQEDINTYIDQIYKKEFKNNNILDANLAIQPIDFNPKEKRDPFTFLSQTPQAIKKTPCLEQDDIPKLGLFRQFAIKDLIFKGVIREKDQMLALVMSKDDFLLPIKLGQIIGKNRGIVENISQEQIAVTEFLSIDSKCWQKKSKVLKIE